MEKKGTICKIDEVGRVVISKKYREALALETGSKIELVLLDHAILLQPCHFGKCTKCEHSIDLSKNYCANCGKKITKREYL